MSVDYRQIARQKASKYGLLPEVFERQIQAESSFNPAAVSSVGALGIAQIMPETARGWGVNPRDPVAALDAAAKNMAAYIKTYGGFATKDPVKVRQAYEKGLQAYNAGPGSVGRYLPQETKNYIQKIIGPDKFSFTEALKGRSFGRQSVIPQEGGAVSPISLPKFNFQKAMEDVVQNYVAKQIAPSQTGGNPEEYLALANKLEEEGTEESNALADIYRQKALEVAGASTVAASDPLDLVKQIVKAKGQEITYNQEIGEIEDMLNKAIGAQQGPRQTAPAGGSLTPSKGISIPGVTITSPVDTSGEPGFDFVIGQRGTPFPVPFKAQVLKVVGNQNWETRLETGKGGPRGYGNYVDVRAIDPATGRAFDVRFAHFDKVNPNIKPGDVVNPGTLIGTQGRTGSTTGAHVSADFYEPDKNTASRDILQIRDRIRDRLAKGLPVFG